MGMFNFKWLTREQVVDVYNSLNISILERVSNLEKQNSDSKKIEQLEKDLIECRTMLESLIKEITVEDTNKKSINFIASC